MENKLSQYWRKANQWFYRTADRALDEAYKAALKIKAIEDEHFGGENIEVSAADPNNQVATYFQNDLNKYLSIARIRLAEFQTSRAITGNNYPQPPESQQFDGQGFSDINPYTPDIEYEARILEKLSFIDELLARYADRTAQLDNYNARTNLGQRAIDAIAPPDIDGLAPTTVRSLTTNRSALNSRKTLPDRRPSNPMSNRPDLDASRPQENINKKALIDPSLIATFRRIQQDLNPKAETQVIANYRFSQGKTRTALRFILMLILVPLLVQYISKIVIVGPAIDLYRNYRHADVFLNVNLQREAFEEMELFEKQLKFQQMIGLTPQLTGEQMEERVKTKAEEIKVSFYRQSAEAVKNWFADVLSIVTFAWLITNSQQQIKILKSFLDDLVSGLSDTAKAFIIILLTDTFVGFHSPHGWEVILEVTAKHLGIPENREFNSLFIATFPVLMDTVFKYWIFRYLTGQSPSSVATYKSMNE
ncbi:proton extrusion protein PcxA [Chamaesiphon sp. GL140_3_metabinner_50]|uniref:proton extrusion protein PcxA n=1 Tax=Chamaesiphon sp. GL140_3_metabinner_50 TaxID=2970812 RepID=UPI0025D98903|nr:proton extrusion protein PcxA [Chamaesiphon sp. GL140_3_metabinner_50]